MKYTAYRKGRVVKNSFNENITLLENRTTIIANSYKEAEKIALSRGFWCICRLI